MREASNLDRFDAPEGVCTSVALTDEANAAVIRLVTELWLNKVPMEAAKRATNKWEPIWDLPMDFNGFMFRKAQ